MLFVPNPEQTFFTKSKEVWVMALVPPRSVGSYEPAEERKGPTANLRTKILDFRGFDSNIILILRGGILMSVGDFLEIVSQAILVSRDNASC